MTSILDTGSSYEKSLESQRLAPIHAKKAQSYRSATIYLILIANLAAVVTGCAYIHGLNTIGYQILFYGSAGTGGAAMVTAWGTLTGRAVHSYLAAKHRRRYEEQTHDFFEKSGDAAQDPEELLQKMTTEEFRNLLAHKKDLDPSFLRSLDTNRKELIHHLLYLSPEQFNMFWKSIMYPDIKDYQKQVDEKVASILEYYQDTNSKADSQEFYDKFYQLVGQAFGGKHSEIPMRFWEPERREAALQFYHKKGEALLGILKIIKIKSYADFEKLFNEAENSRNNLPEDPTYVAA